MSEEITENVDQIIESVEQSTPNAEIPMEASTPTPQEYTIKADGKEVKAGLDQLLKWAEMGYGAPNKIGSLNKQLEDFKKRSSQWETVEKTYKPVDEFAKQNPEWWQHVQKAWEARQTFAQSNPDNPLVSDLQSLKQELSELKKFREDIEQQKQTYQTQMEDQALDKQIQSIKQEYADLDWKSVDLDNKSLEARVMDHALKNNIATFRAAFRDYCYDDLLKRSMDKGKEAVTNEMRKNTKLGILGETQAPTKALNTAQNVKSKTYEDLMKEALSELPQAQ